MSEVGFFQNLKKRKAAIVVITSTIFFFFHTECITYKTSPTVCCNVLAHTACIEE